MVAGPPYVTLLLSVAGLVALGLIAGTAHQQEHRHRHHHHLIGTGDGAVPEPEKRCRDPPEVRRKMNRMLRQARRVPLWAEFLGDVIPPGPRRNNRRNKEEEGAWELRHRNVDPAVCDAQFQFPSQGPSAQESPLCPWNWVITHDPFRIPERVGNATCVCDECRVRPPEGDYMCRPIRFALRVIRRGPCNVTTGRYDGYRTGWEVVNVGCVCSLSPAGIPIGMVPLPHSII